MLKTNRHVLRRFALKTCLLAFIALVQWHQALWSLLLLSFTTAVADTGLAIMRRKSISAPTFNYWDEAALMLLISMTIVVATPLAFSTPF